MLRFVRIGVHIRGGVLNPVALILTSTTGMFQANLLAYGVVDGKGEACYHSVSIHDVARLPPFEATKLLEPSCSCARRSKRLMTSAVSF